jgi:hypothetical protein
MPDQFLKDYHQPPRREFTRALFQRLASRNTKAEKMTTRFVRSLALGGLTLLLAFALTLAVSPAVRAQMLDLARSVGGVAFTETGKYPGVPEREVTIVPSEIYTLAEVRDSIGFEIALPGWVPEGYTLQDEVTVTDFSSPDSGSDVIMADLRWRNPEPWEMPITLNVSWRASGQPMQWTVGPDSVEEVLVNGQSAALVRGIWNADQRRWTSPEHLSLHWQHQGRAYQLQVTEAQITAADLIQMAESVP